MNYKNDDIITYRDTPYEYHEWTTFDGKPAKGFHCDDETLLQHVNVVSFGTMTEIAMHNKIDDYLDNIEHHKEMQRLHDAGCQAYYDSKTRWDNFTGD